MKLADLLLNRRVTEVSMAWTSHHVPGISRNFSDKVCRAGGILQRLELSRGWRQLSREPWAESAVTCHLQMITKKSLERRLSGPATLLVPQRFFL